MSKRKRSEDDYELPQHTNEPELDNVIQLPTRVQSPVVTKKEEQWGKLISFLDKWFCEPDVEALKICLSVYACHCYLENDPIWMFVISPPGSGKTSVAIRALSFLPNTHMIGDLNTNSFLSGFGENNGLLGNLTKKHNGNGVLLFPDFTSFLSKRQDVKTELMGQMRQIYDGYYSKSVGNKGDTVWWRGKVSCVAAVTPALENYWGTHRSLGERFLNVRWRQPNGPEMAEFAERQIDHEGEIRDRFDQLVRDYVDSESSDFRGVGIEKGRELGLKHLAYIVSILRTNVTRDNRTRRVVDVDEPESPARIAKSLAMIAKGSATLDRRASINAYDLELSHRVALDSMDKNRGKVMKQMFDGRLINGQLVYERMIEGEHGLKKTTKMPEAMLTRVLEDLQELEVIRVEERSDYTLVSLTEKVEKSWDDSIGFSADN